MPGVLTREGRKLVAEQLTSARNEGDISLLLRLFTNEGSFGVNPDVSDFTDASFGGYDPWEFLLNDQNPPTLEGDDYVILLSDAARVWDCTSSPQTIRGWFLTRGDTSAVLAYDVYDTPDELEVGSRHTLFAELKIGQCA